MNARVPNLTQACATAPTAPALRPTRQVALTLDGEPVTARPGETILQAGATPGRAIPRLCYSDGLRPDGNCRACVVEIAGERTLAPSCCRSPTPGMARSGQPPRPQEPEHGAGTAAGRPAEHRPQVGRPTMPPSPMANSANGPLQQGVRAPRFHRPARQQPAPDLSHPAMAVNLDACIQCNRCVRACREDAGERRHRRAGRGRGHPHRVRPGRPHGRQQLRGLW
jgi:formate dehydrogenase major subunit